MIPLAALNTLKKMKLFYSCMRAAAKYFVLLWIASLSAQQALAQPSVKVDTIKLFSKALQKNTSLVLIQPQSAETGKRYPVLYLLHGYTGNYSNWIVKVPALKKWAALFNMIVVCPDGENSWYINQPGSHANQYEDFLSSELVTYIDAHYPTLPAADKRGITGLSMGGHGALTLAIKYPQVWGAAGSMSGAVDMISLQHKYNLDKLTADSVLAQFSWQNHSALQLADSQRIHKTALMIDCGIDDIFIQQNRALHQKLLEQKIPHYYTERNGAHNWYYWATALPYQMLFFDRFFNRE